MIESRINIDQHFNYESIQQINVQQNTNRYILQRQYNIWFEKWIIGTKMSFTKWFHLQIDLCCLRQHCTWQQKQRIPTMISFLNPVDYEIDMYTVFSDIDADRKNVQFV